MDRLLPLLPLFLTLGQRETERIALIFDLVTQILRAAHPVGQLSGHCELVLLHVKFAATSHTQADYIGAD